MKGILAKFLTLFAFLGLGKEFKPSITNYNPNDHNKDGAYNGKYKFGGTTTHAAATSPEYYPYTKQRPFKDRIFYLPPKGMYEAGKSGGLERKATKIGRNQPCPCGSTQDKNFFIEHTSQVQTIPVPVKYKNCCINKQLFFKPENAPKNAKKIG